MKDKITKVFSKDYLKDELGLPYSAIKDDIVDNSRWSIHHEIIFEDKGKFYKAYYSVGATEVELKKVMVTKWVDKEIEQ